MLKNFRPYKRADQVLMCDYIGEFTARYVGDCPITREPLYTVNGDETDPRGPFGEKFTAATMFATDYDGAKRDLTVAWLVTNDCDLYHRALDLMMKD